MWLLHTHGRGEYRCRDAAPLPWVAVPHRILCRGNLPGHSCHNGPQCPAAIQIP
jgi:hypothetical protein